MSQGCMVQDDFRVKHQLAQQQGWAGVVGCFALAALCAATSSLVVCLRVVQLCSWCIHHLLYPFCHYKVLLQKGFKRWGVYQVFQHLGGSSSDSGSYGMEAVFVAPSTNPQLSSYFRRWFQSANTAAPGGMPVGRGGGRPCLYFRLCKMMTCMCSCLQGLCRASAVTWLASHMSPSSCHTSPSSCDLLGPLAFVLSSFEIVLHGCIWSSEAFSSLGGTQLLLQVRTSAWTAFLLTCVTVVLRSLFLYKALCIDNML